MRKSGVLLPISALPTPFGIGDLGESAHAFARTLFEAGQSVWQILPLTIPDPTHSPYASPSAFAGDPLLIDPFGLVSMGLLTKEEVEAEGKAPGPQTDYGRAARVKEALFQKAYDRFTETEELRAFREREIYWLYDHALFSAVHAHLSDAPLAAWPASYRDRHSTDVHALEGALSREVGYHIFLQYVFDRQLSLLKETLSSLGITLLGDIPFYVAEDSADVWAHPELFVFDKVAGVPPDFFTPTGQLWGNPLYNWHRMKEDGYAFWLSRLARAAQMYDTVRLDHFRAFDSYYAIPKGAPDAREGEWLPGPGDDFFAALYRRLPAISLIAEDLGDLTPSVGELRGKWGLPGMRILQFAFNGDPGHPFLPHNYEKNTVCYLGTHDNNTVVGFWEETDAFTRQNAAAYLGISLEAHPRQVSAAMMRAASASPADTVIFTLQDICAEGSERRMNTPGKTEGCWLYGLIELPRAENFSYLKEITALYGRYKR